MMCSPLSLGRPNQWGKVMKKLIAAVAFLAAQWKPANAQTILGSIPEEFRGDWCWQENTNGEQIVIKLKPRACSRRAPCSRDVCQRAIW